MSEVLLTGPQSVPAPRSALAGSMLQQMLQDIDLAAATALAWRHLAVAAALQPYLGHPDLLCGVECPCSSERYVRHLLHAGTQHTVLALVWRPGQMSPFHGHRSWCAP